jgi:hypothetical protein
MKYGWKHRFATMLADENNIGNKSLINILLGRQNAGKQMEKFCKLVSNRASVPS